jgi:hypothetical protein
VSDRLKYYSCPECGKEVNKYWLYKKN